MNMIQCYCNLSHCEKGQSMMSTYELWFYLWDGCLQMKWARYMEVLFRLTYVKLDPSYFILDERYLWCCIHHGTIFHGHGGMQILELKNCFACMANHTLTEGVIWSPLPPFSNSSLLLGVSVVLTINCICMFPLQTETKVFRQTFFATCLTKSLKKICL